MVTACTAAPAAPAPTGKDSSVADYISPADTDPAAIRNLHPLLRQALDEATGAARSDGVELLATPGDECPQPHPDAG